MHFSSDAPPKSETGAKQLRNLANSKKRHCCKHWIFSNHVTHKCYSSVTYFRAVNRWWGLIRSWCWEKQHIPTVLQGHKHRVTTLEKSCRPTQNPAEPHRTLEETPAESSENSSERQISLESLAEGCAPRMVTLQSFRNNTTYTQNRKIKSSKLKPALTSATAGAYQTLGEPWGRIFLGHQGPCRLGFPERRLKP